MIGIMVSGQNGAMFFCFTNGVMVNQYFCTYGEMVKSLWCNGEMVKLSNGESVFGDTFSSMVKW